MTKRARCNTFATREHLREHLMDESIPDATTPRRDALWDLALLFLRFGTLSMGGPAAHIAMMEDEVVRRRRWMTRDRLLDLISAANLIPGPTSTELAIHIGHERAGWAGLVVAGACFILPAVAIVLAIAWAYVRYADRRLDPLAAELRKRLEGGEGQ